jgi:APA family basic amino acid/polyamine antiporter
MSCDVNGTSRVFYTMSKMVLLPSFFSDHAKFRTPWKTNLFLYGIQRKLFLQVLCDAGHVRKYWNFIM